MTQLISHSAPGCASPENDKTHSEQSRAFGKMPNVVARNQELSAAGLVVLAYRCTFAGNYGLHETTLKGIVKGDGLGTNSARRAIAESKKLGYLERWQKSRSLGCFGYAKDRLNLPECGGGYRLVRREWFDGTLSLKALAALLFIRAGTQWTFHDGTGRKNKASFAREVAARFGWARNTADRALKELRDRGLIERKRLRKDDGRFRATVYVPAQLAKPAPATAQKPCNGSPCNGNPCDTHRDITLHVLHKKNPHELHKDCTSFRSKDVPPKGHSDDWLKEQAFSSPNLLGWDIADDLSPAIEAFFDSVHDDDVAAVTAAARDHELAEAIRTATGRRVRGELLTPVGLYAVRYLAACLIADTDMQPLEALRALIQAMQDRIGSRPGEWLNSLSVIAQRFAGAGYDGIRDFERPFAATHKHLAELRKADSARLLAPHLFDSGKGLARLLSEFGEDAVEIIRDMLARAAIDGAPAGSIAAWSYFKPTLEECRRLETVYGHQRMKQAFAQACREANNGGRK